MSLYEELNQRIEILRAENERDWLTGLLNRGAAESRINEVIERDRGALILVDINGFHKINSKYGHLAGDRALQQLASILSRMVLKSDIIGRIGGDEFVIFIRGERNDSFLMERTQQIQSRVATEFFPDIGTKSLKLSFGWAQSDIADTYETLFTRAERKLNETQSLDIVEGDDTFAHSIQVDGKRIRAALKEPGAISGAFEQDYDHFEVLYRYIERTMKRSGRGAFILLLTLASNDGSMPDFTGRSDTMSILGECIRTSLRISDVFTQYSSSQYLIMNVDTDMRYSEQIANRVRTAFYKKAGSTCSNLLLHESYPMGSVPKES